METTFQVVSNFSNIGHMIIFNGLCILFGELELDFVTKEELDHEIHDFSIFLIFKVVVQKHLYATSHQEFPPIFIFMHCCYWPVAWIGQRARGQDRKRGQIYIQSGSLYIYEISTLSPRLLLILLLLIIPGPHHKLIISCLGLFSIPINNSSYLFI